MLTPISTAELAAALPHVLEAPRNSSIVDQLCTRPARNARVFPDRITLSSASGVAGDRAMQMPWLKRDDGSPDPRIQVSILPRRAQCLATVALPPSIRAVVGACESAGGVMAGYTQIQQAPSGQVLFNTVLGGGVSAAGAEDHVPEVDPVFVCNSIRTLLWLFPSLAGTDLLRSWVRYEAVTPDDRFIVGPTEIPGLYVAAGDGGTGFGRAPAIARVIADTIDGRAPPFDAGVWSPARFAARAAA